MKIAGLVLASGSSNRMKIDKLQIPYRGKTILKHVIDTLVSCPGVSEVVVVRKPGEGVSGVSGKEIKVVPNEDHLQGMSTSLICGINAMSRDTDAFIMLLGDMPFVSPALCGELIEKFTSSPCKILVPVFEGKNGHPVVFSMDIKNELLKIEGDIGARNVIKKHPGWVEYHPVTTEQILLDIDTCEDLERLNDDS